MWGYRRNPEEHLQWDSRDPSKTSVCEASGSRHHFYLIYPSPMLSVLFPSQSTLGQNDCASRQWCIRIITNLPNRSILDKILTFQAANFRESHASVYPRFLWDSIHFKWYIIQSSTGGSISVTGNLCPSTNKCLWSFFLHIQTIYSSNF